MKFDQLELLDGEQVCYCWLNTGTGIMYADEKFGAVALSNFYLNRLNAAEPDPIVKLKRTVFRDGTSIIVVQTLSGSRYVRCYAYLTVQPDISLFLNYAYVNATADKSLTLDEIFDEHDFG